jgi:hypothetical protein
MDARGARLGVLLDYMGVVGWVKGDLFARDVPDDVVRRITPRDAAFGAERDNFGSELLRIP